MRRLVPSMMLVAVLVAGGCGIPEDDSAEAISAELPTVAQESPTEVPDPGSSTVTIFLLDVNENMTEVSRELAGPDVTISALVAELIADTSDEEKELGLTTALPSGLMFNPESPSLEGDLAILDFVSGGLEALEGGELNKALAQLVWTLTATEEIERIAIRIDGFEESWPTDGDDANVLTKDQYATFDPAFVEEVPTPDPGADEDDGGG